MKHIFKKSALDLNIPKHQHCELNALAEQAGTSTEKYTSKLIKEAVESGEFFEFALSRLEQELVLPS